MTRIGATARVAWACACASAPACADVAIRGDGTDGGPDLGAGTSGRGPARSGEAASGATREPGGRGSGSDPGADGTGGEPDTATDGATADSGGAAPPRPAAVPQFVEVADAAGISYVQGTVHVAPQCLIDQIGPGVNGYCTPERMLAGAAVGDVDDDGDGDLFVTRTGATDILFRNDGDGSFTDVSAAAGVTALEHSAGAAFGDIDNDGDLDLFVATIGSFRHLLYVNDGSGHFDEQGLPRGAAIDSGVLHVGTSAAFGDYDLDGWLDLYVGEWRTVAGLGEGPSNARLLHNLGDAAPGVFEDVTVAAGVAIDDVWATLDDGVPGTFAFAPAFADLDGDRYPELAIASDYGTSRLFWNDGDGSFTDVTAAAGVGLDGNGMGSALGDIDDDGDLDWYVTSITAPNLAGDNRLYRNLGDQHFGDVGVALGVAAGGWGWGAALFDANDDGRLDLLATSGYYFPAHLDDTMKLWLHAGAPGELGPFVDVSAQVGFGGPRQRRGVLTWDYDDDGDLDVLVTSNCDGPELYRNDHDDDADWLRVRVVGSASNRDGLGARVTVRATADGSEQLREIGTGSHYMGHGERIAHFGLGVGDDPVAELRVYWPATDQLQVLTDVARNQTIVIEEP